MQKRFEEFRIPLIENRQVTLDDDPSTLFICSGMQPFKQRFSTPDGGLEGTLQSCIRTSDIDLVGDGSHLTHFKMLGNFSFGRDDYEVSVDLWHAILSDLRIPVTEIHVHPSRPDHQQMWKRRGYQVIRDESCQWSDGNIGGQSCEVFVGDLEIGNLVNPLGHSTDVGFGWERLIQVVENKSRIDETSLFSQHDPPVVRDHVRTVSILWENEIHPGNKGRNYVCRRLVRRLLGYLPETESFPFDGWIRDERELRRQCLQRGQRMWRKHNDKPIEFWWETFGVLPEEIHLLET